MVDTALCARPAMVLASLDFADAQDRFDPILVGNAIKTKICAGPNRWIIL